MRLLLSWIKSNPVTLASILVALAAIVAIIWVQLQGSALQSKMAKSHDTMGQIDNYMSQDVEIPPEKPDNPPQRKGPMTITPVAIDQIQKLYGRMNDEYKQLFSKAVSFNKAGHQVLVPDLFPKTNRPDVPLNARDQYLQSIRNMVKPYPDNAPQGAVAPRLDAGQPPAKETLQNAAARVNRDFMNSPSVSGRQLSAEQQKNLRQEKRSKMIELLQNRAQSIHIYAATDINDPNYPFDVAPWAQTGNPPQIFQLWEAQLELWIQQDVVRAIAMTNKVSDPDSNVTTAPIKRLLSIEVIPGYIGLHTRGGLFPDSGNPQLTNYAYPAPVGGMTGDKDQRVSRNFYVGPTGRVSNALYDVRQVRVTLDVDYKRLPEFFNNLSHVNFMTVLQTKLNNIDEYNALKEDGYVYGSDDVMRATILIETIWLRDWTKPLMPQLTREYVGIDKPTDISKTPEQNAPGMPPPGVPGYGGGPAGPPNGVPPGY